MRSDSALPVTADDALGLDGPGARDYAAVRRAIRYLTETAGEQPELDDLAIHLGLSPSHVQRLFKRWCGLSPKEFTQALTLDHARRMLDGSASVLDTAHEVGLSGGSRLHDLFITHEAVTPGDIRRRGAGLTMAYGWHDTPFGKALAAMTPRGLAGLAFLDEERADARTATLLDMQARWPAAAWRHDPALSAREVAMLFAGTPLGTPVPIVMIGTDFEVRVWQLLTRIPAGRAVCYSDIAKRVCTARASRAVGAAIGRNPLAFVVPCHRVLRSDGGLGGYHWNVTRKRALIGWEARHIPR
ncbi:MAG: bifunctional helix-turn-helix domain-containing protein/methylated-DNA--[protein]-cysteine S-methyltransferase [Hyphomicrobiaceae bacterium]|nr:bifunctional helix-turn-helix domain-containing protein/methylated-DNA--[protein]-cysteine S-methyltransferase [Hyphomicrobiaceae bacterium]